jgi:hypothetical protein
MIEFDKPVIQVDMKKEGHHPIILLEINNPAYIEYRQELRMYTNANQKLVEENSMQQLSFIGGKLGGFVKNL